MGHIPRTIGPLVTFFALGVAVSANGQTLSERAAGVSGESFVRAFLGNCAQTPGNFDIVVNASKAMNFKDLPEEMKPLLAPQDPNANFVGFFADSGEAAPYFIGVSTGEIETGKFVTCAIANPYINTAEVVAALESFAQLTRPDHDETAMGQRYRFWSTNDWSQGSSISLTDAEPMGYGGATLAMIAPSID